MKLLSPKLAVERGNKDEQDGVLRIGYLNETLNKLQARINTEQENFEKRIVEQRDIYGTEKRVLQDEVRALSVELDSLNKQRKQMMVPVRELEAEARKKEESARALLEEAELTKIEADELHLLYQEKLDSITSREQDIETRSLALTLREEGARKEADMVSAGHERLNNMTHAFLADVAKQVSIVSERESAVTKREQFATDTLYEYHRKNAETERRLRDKEQALERGFAELRAREDAIKVIK